MEKIEKTTPNGGAYYYIYYYDDTGKSVDKSIATKSVICEFDKDDRMIKETIFKFKNRNNNEN